MPDGSSCFAGCAELRVKLRGQRKRVHRFDRPTVLVTKTDLTYTVTLQTFCTLLSGNRRDAVVSQPLLRQPPAEAERVAYRSSSRSGPWSPRGRLRLLGRSPDARCVRRNWGLHTFRGRVPQWWPPFCSVLASLCPSQLTAITLPPPLARDAPSSDGAEGASAQS